MPPIDIAAVQTEEGTLSLSVGIDRTAQCADTALPHRATRLLARDCLAPLLKAVPYKIHTILPDNGIQCTKREGTEEGCIIPLDRICLAHGIDHRMTKITHPWTNGQVERMPRTLKEATVKNYDC